MIKFTNEVEANHALNKLQYSYGGHFEGHKFKVVKLLASIKEKPNDSDNNGSDPSSDKNENSVTKSNEE